ncbi:MAG: hypothetical protein H7A24_14365 [Leptospiraceae bacterium]|nr:hypothetical protein [Leptospiraceae bacterium]MCP5513066.1 hypothetical protein [Leptospiraceae bacterium]
MKYIKIFILTIILLFQSIPIFSQDSAGAGWQDLNPNLDYNFKSYFANHDKEKTPVHIQVGILILNISNYNIKEGRFTVDFYLSYASDKPMPEMSPHLTNGFIEEDDLIRLIANEPTFKLWKIHGVFYNYPDLRNYPFDLQELSIEIEEADNGVDSVQFIPVNDFINLDSDFQFPGWDVRFTEVSVVNHYYPDRFENDDLYYPRILYKLGISRFSTNAVFSVFFPAFVIVLVSLSGIWLKPEQIEAKISSTAPMLAAAVLFHYSLIQELPSTPYLTRADKLMMAVYTCLMMNMLISWAFSLIPLRFHQKLDKFSRTFVPPLNLLIFVVGSFV